MSLSQSYCIAPPMGGVASRWQVKYHTSPDPSAAWRGRDGAVKVVQGTVRGVDGDGDREVEDSGSRGAPVKDGHGRAPCFSRAVRGQHLGLKLQQLAHEAEVGGDDTPPLLHKFKGLVQLHSVSPHEVSKTDGG